MNYVVGFILAGCVVPTIVFGFTATSTNFHVNQAIVSIGGGNPTSSVSTSTNFQLFGAGGQTGTGTSTIGSSFTLYGGFLRSMFKSVRPTYTLEHFHWRNDDGTETSATSGTLGVQDTATSSVPKSAAKRLRIAVSNEGGTQANYSATQFRLEYGLKSTTCGAISSWSDVGAGAGDWDMSDSSNVTNGGNTTNIALGSGGVGDENKYFIGDGGVRDTASETSAQFVESHSFYEIEYSIQALAAATDSGTYCFRVTASGTDTLFVYDVYPEATLAAGAGTRPIASAVSIDSGAAAVTLTENTIKNVSCVGTVTDTDEFADITSVTADLYRTSVGVGGGEDDNNYYQLAGDAECVPSGGSGNSETYTCTFAVQYFADPTDTGSPNASDTWTCTMTPSDGVGAGTAASDTIEMNSLMALTVTATIAYGSVNANADTGSVNQTTTVTNTGNRDMDPELSGVTMADGGNSIAVGQQKYADAAFTYTSGGVALSTTPTAINVTLPQRTGGAISDDVLWGLGVPNGTPIGSYTGTNTFTAVAGL